jgi:hypothetical protein
MIRRLRLLGWLFVATSAFCQSPELRPDPTTLFQQVSGHLLQDVKQLPRYTCLQGIERQFYHARYREKDACAGIISKFEARKHELPLTSWDRLHLDVTVADNREVHSWPGTSEFNEDEIRELVRNGPFGGGDFGPFITAVFGDAAVVKFQGERLVEGRPVFEYSYAIPTGVSQYQVETPSGPAVTAYGGSFFLDPQTADIVRLIVRTAVLPGSSGACLALSEVEYSRMNIHSRQLLIPHQTRLHLIYGDGKEAVCVTSYSSCHEYASEAVLHFDIANPSPGTASAQPSPLVKALLLAEGFPKGLTFACRMVTAIDSGAASAGDAVEGFLRSPIRDRSGVVLASPGSRLRGRLVRVAEYMEYPEYFEVGIRLESIEIDGVPVPLSATLVNPTPAPEHKLTGYHVGVLLDMNLPDTPSPLPSNVGAFFFMGTRFHLNHWDADWITVSPVVRVKSPSLER